MSTIAERLKALLRSPLLREAVDTRVAEGLKKYGQTLDDNQKPDRAKAVHMLQELLDASGYGLWHGRTEAFPFMDALVLGLVEYADDLAAAYPDLTLEELLFKEGHSGAQVAPQASSTDQLTDKLAEVFAEADAEIRSEAQLWRGLMALPYMRVLGTGGLADDGSTENGYVHAGMEFWTRHNYPPEWVDKDTARSRRVLLALAQNAPQEPT